MKKIIVVLLKLMFSSTLIFGQQALSEPKDGRIFLGAQSMTFENGNDPHKVFLDAFHDSTILHIEIGDTSELIWDERFGYPGTGGEVNSMVIMGNDLYVAGRFSQAGEANLDSLNRGKGNVARWDGTRWHPLGNGLQGYVFALAVKDTILYAAGAFAIPQNIAKWDGKKWTALGTGVGRSISEPVYALTVVGEYLYAGGKFTTAGGIDAKYIARWDGSNWSALGEGMSNKLGSSCYVSALTSIGQDLYAGGLFTNAGSVSSPGIAHWDGSQWTAVGSGTSAAVLALTAMNNDLYAGGAFVQAGGIDVFGIAKWNGMEWSALGIGMNYNVNSLAVIENKLYAGGLFYDAGGIYASRVASWDGIQWSALDEGIYGSIGELNPEVKSLTSMGTDLFVGGQFTIAGNSGASMVAKWSGSKWYSLGSGKGIGEQVRSLAIHGSDVYAGGSFSSAGNIGANNIAKWDGTKWSALGDGVNYGGVDCLAFLGNDLFAGGMFYSAGDIEAHGIARWDGNQWLALPGNHTQAKALLGIGSELYVGGWQYVSIWNGMQWNDIANDIDGDIYAFGKIDRDLYAAGKFSKIGGVNAYSIAKWNGANWSPLGAGLTGEPITTGISPGSVRSMAIIGNDVYVNGYFVKAGEVAAEGIARWDGSQWSDLGGTPPKVSNFTMAVIGNDLYVVGTNQDLYKWDGTNWIDLCSKSGNGFNATVLAMAASGNELWFGGIFTTVEKKVSASIAHCTGLPSIVDVKKIQVSETFMVQNFPNPFHSSTQIWFYLPQPAKVTVKIVNQTGEVITTLISKELSAGYHATQWSAEKWPSGIYYCQVKANRSEIVNKLVLIK
jgi:trimeric autotransporter adhesin